MATLKLKDIMWLRDHNPDAAAEKARTIRAELDKATEQLGKKNLELQQVLSWARQNLLSADELKPRLAQVREQKQHWEEEMRRLNQKLGSLQAGAGNLADAEKLCLSIRERLVNVTAQQKKEFLRLVVERIWVDKNNNLEIEVVIPKLEKQANDVICETPLSFQGEGGKNFKRGAKPLSDAPFRSVDKPANRRLQACFYRVFFRQEGQSGSFTEVFAELPHL